MKTRDENCGFFYSPPLEGCPQGGVALQLNRKVQIIEEITILIQITIFKLSHFQIIIVSVDRSAGLKK